MGDLTYAEAVSLFEQWGFQIESGPRADEVTLILEAPDSRTCTVHPKSMLPQMAAVILAVRWRNGTAGCWTKPIKMMLG
jgi:hypothetical protein